ELHQLIGMPELPRRQIHRTITTGKITAQRHNAPDIMRLIFLQYRAQAVTRTAYTRQMRRSIMTCTTNIKHSIQGSMLSRTTGTESYREITRIELSQLRTGRAQLFDTRWRLGWKELEAEVLLCHFSCSSNEDSTQEMML